MAKVFPFLPMVKESKKHWPWEMILIPWMPSVYPQRSGCQKYSRWGEFCGEDRRLWPFQRPRSVCEEDNGMHVRRKVLYVRPKFLAVLPNSAHWSLTLLSAPHRADYLCDGWPLNLWTTVSTPLTVMCECFESRLHYITTAYSDYYNLLQQIANGTSDWIHEQWFYMFACGKRTNILFFNVLL